MAATAVTFALAALLLPAAAFLVIGLLPPLRRSGRPAAVFSILCMAAAFTFAVLAWSKTGTALISEMRAVPVFQATWNWLPSAAGPFATVGVLVDGQSSS